MLSSSPRHALRVGSEDMDAVLTDCGAGSEVLRTMLSGVFFEAVCGMLRDVCLKFMTGTRSAASRT